jgi:hypothetical protein
MRLMFDGFDVHFQGVGEVLKVQMYVIVLFEQLVQSNDVGAGYFSENFTLLPVEGDFLFCEILPEQANEGIFGWFLQAKRIDPSLSMNYFYHWLLL